MKQKLSKRTRKTIINIVVLVVLVGITFGILFATYGTEELNFANIGAFLSSCEPGFLVAATACMLASIIFEGLALFLIARRLGHKSKLHQSMAYSTADVYYSALTPSASGGQPASLYYMCRDGMSGGIAGFTLVLNLLAYSTSIIIMGIFAFIAKPAIFSGTSDVFAQTLIIIGFVLQVLFFAFCIVCIMWSKALLKIGNGIISLGTKMKIVKKPDKWRARWQGVVDKYRSSRDVIKSHPTLFFEALFFNLAQRVSYVLIPCFLCFGTGANIAVLKDGAATPDLLDLFCMQTFVLLGYNSIPLPGGTGAFEYMYLNVYGEFYTNAFVLSAMMMSRALSYYLRFILSGLYTLIYHSVGLRGKKTDKQNAKPVISADAPDWLKEEIAEAVENMSDGDDAMIPNTPDETEKENKESAENDGGEEEISSVPDTPTEETAQDVAEPPVGGEASEQEEAVDNGRQ